MKNTLRLFALLAVMVPVLQSCGDDDSDGGGSKSKTEYLTSGGWKISGMSMNGLDITDQLDDCDTDDIMTFKSDKTGTLDEGATKCDENDPQTEDFTWMFLESETKIVQDGDTLDIDKLDGSSMELSITDPFFGLSVKTTFKH